MSDMPELPDLRPVEPEPTEEPTTARVWPTVLGMGAVLGVCALARLPVMILSALAGGGALLGALPVALRGRSKTGARRGTGRSRGVGGTKTGTGRTGSVPRSPKGGGTGSRSLPGWPKGANRLRPTKSGTGTRTAHSRSGSGTHSPRSGTSRSRFLPGRSGSVPRSQSAGNSRSRVPARTGNVPGKRAAMFRPGGRAGGVLPGSRSGRTGGASSRSTRTPRLPGLGKLTGGGSGRSRTGRRLGKLTSTRPGRTGGGSGQAPRRTTARRLGKIPGAVLGGGIAAGILGTHAVRAARRRAKGSAPMRRLGRSRPLAPARWAGRSARGTAGRTVNTAGRWLAGKGPAVRAHRLRLRKVSSNRHAPWMRRAAAWTVGATIGGGLIAAGWVRNRRVKTDDSAQPEEGKPRYIDVTDLPPIVSPGRPVNVPGDSPTGKDQDPMSQHIDAATEAIEQSIGGFQPESATELSQFLERLPELFASMTTSLVRVSDTLGEEFPVAPNVAEMLREGQSGLAALADHYEETYRTFRVEHEKELQRIEEPRPNEQIWDTSAQD